MKLQIVLAALATLLLPVHGVGLQCAGGIPDNRGDGSGIIYENSGFLTSDFTQKACAASGGSILPNTKGNKKCCDHPAVREFNVACESLKAGANYPTYQPFPGACPK